MVAGKGAGCGRTGDVWGLRGCCSSPGTRLPTLVLALALAWLLPAADSLDMNIFASPKNVFLNSEVLLECKFTGFTAPLDLRNVGVLWYGPGQEQIYAFETGEHRRKKPGTEISDIELSKGDASLLLNNVQLADEGNYTCVVFVTPEKAQKSSELRVLAQPKLHLSTQHVTIETGAEKLVTCDATGFYPEAHNIYWEKVSKDKTEKLSHDVFNTLPVRNPDKTFNVSSAMRIKPTLVDNGNVYKCVMDHKSYTDPLSLELKLTVEDSLDMNIFASPMEVHLNESVLLECKFTGFTAPLDLTNVGVQWFGPGQEKIYVFETGVHKLKKPGTEISDIELSKGDASLHLNNVQLNNEGQYTCVVFVTPEKAQKSSELRVLAQPKLHLSTQHVTIETGAEKLVTCDATGFYPEAHNIYWEKVSKDKTEKLSHDVFNTPPVRNPDKTFNVSSAMRIEPTLVDNGNVYKCVMEHKSYTDPLSLELKLTVEEPVEHSSTGAILGVLFAGIILCALIAFGLYVYFVKYKPAPPKITGSNGHQTMQHLEKEMATWWVCPFRPREIIIRLYLRRKGEIYDMRNTILDWDSRKSTENRNGKINGEGHNEASILMNSNYVNASFTPLEPKYDTDADGISSVMINVEIYPDVNQDAGAELTIEVQHKSLKQPISKTLILDVKGVPPKVSNIFKPSCIIHNESTSLICSITGFKPRPLRITWQRKRKNMEAEEIVRMEEDNRTTIHGGDGEMSTYKHYISEMKHDDESYSITSVLELVPDIQQDQDSLYTCKVHHSGTSDQEREIKLIIAVIPKVELKCHTDKILDGVPMTISCQINAFYPKDITVKWLKNDEEMLQNFKVAEPVIGQDGLYHVASDVEIVPTRAESTAKYTCRVSHSSLTEPLHIEWVAGEIVSLPELTAIEVDPLCPEMGKEVTLSCKAYGFYPEVNDIFWFKDFEKVKDPFKVGITLGPNELDTENGCYSRLSKWKFTPAAVDHGKEFKMKVLHSTTSGNPNASSYTLKLKGIPIVDDIKYEPPVAASGSQHRLVCKVDNFHPKKIRTSWLRKGKPISHGVEDAVMMEDENGCFQMWSSLSINPTDLQFDEKISFQVTHSRLNTPITKQLSLKLPDYGKNENDLNEKVDEDYGKKENDVNEKVDEDYGKNENDLNEKVDEDNGKVENDVSEEVNKEKLKVVSKITCRPEKPKAGHPVMLSSEVRDASADQAHIIWYKDTYPFDEHRYVTNTPFENEYGFTTTLTYTPKEADGNHIQVFIDVNMEEHVRDFALILS
ncbi:uncharacterized protein LOC129705966 isoform X5 [Leucoraja erinacea]|uniref:uncharacterized protein LOC129705966 isoform X5 n=1 Tax=Leucoraja erinaceus TaxID=7782 RepID=UPI002455ABA0|nr:uncharacterized protein LOC129705966 isoform X5 [Leucoraja erinacea]